MKRQFSVVEKEGEIAEMTEEEVKQLIASYHWVPKLNHKPSGTYLEAVRKRCGKIETKSKSNCCIKMPHRKRPSGTRLNSHFTKLILLYQKTIVL